MPRLHPLTSLVLLAGLAACGGDAEPPRAATPVASRPVEARDAEVLADALADLLDRVPDESATAPEPEPTAPADPPTASDAAARQEEELREERLAALEDAGDAERLERLLAVEPGSRSVGVLIGLTRHDADAQVRAAAVLKLGVAREPEVQRALVDALGDAEPGVAVLAAEALARRGDPSAIPYLRDLESHPDLRLRRAAEVAVLALERRAASHD